MAPYVQAKDQEFKAVLGIEGLLQQGGGLKFIEKPCFDVLTLFKDLVEFQMVVTHLRSKGGEVRPLRPKVKGPSSIEIEIQLGVRCLNHTLTKFYQLLMCRVKASGGGHSQNIWETRNRRGRFLRTLHTQWQVCVFSNVHEASSHIKCYVMFFKGGQCYLNVKPKVW